VEFANLTNPGSVRSPSHLLGNFDETHCYISISPGITIHVSTPMQWRHTCVSRGRSPSGDCFTYAFFL